MTYNISRFIRRWRRSDQRTFQGIVSFKTVITASFIEPVTPRRSYGDIVLSHRHLVDLMVVAGRVPHRTTDSGVAESGEGGRRRRGRVDEINLRYGRFERVVVVAEVAVVITIYVLGMTVLMWRRI